MPALLDATRTARAAMAALVMACAVGDANAKLPTSKIKPVVSSASMADEPFGLSSVRAPQGLLWVKWRRVQQQMRAEAPVLATCRNTEACASAGGRKLAAIIVQAQQRTGRARIDSVNRLVNAAIHYVTDQALHGVPDLWTPPLATLAAGRGDCEDYAIAKYAALRESGLAESDLRLLIVHDRMTGEDHAVLAARHDGRWLILDNRHNALGEAALLPQLKPLYALAPDGVREFAGPSPVHPRKAAALKLAALVLDDMSDTVVVTSSGPDTPYLL
jgi:predicted transglutaminase-like cysteine proteinase